MVSTREKRQSNGTLFWQLEDFQQNIIIGNTASERQENIILKESTKDQNFTVGTLGKISMINVKS